MQQSGIRYSVVLPDNLSGIRYSVVLPDNLGVRQNAIDWCRDIFGSDEGPTGRWWLLDWTIQFKTLEDKTFYLLRWG